MTNYLADVNVWIALVSVGHVHHTRARDWFEEEGTTAVAFCRVTQAGFLRLLNNARVMGPNVLNARAAWGIYDALRSDGRVRFAAEPTGLEEHWRRATRHTHSGPNFWTEAYLKAFAAEAELTLVTFDQALTRHTTGVRLLGS